MTCSLLLLLIMHLCLKHIPTSSWHLPYAAIDTYVLRSAMEGEEGLI